jgi:hypothetical protein
MKAIVISVPDDMKAKLDALRTQGYTLNGYIRGVLTQALADRPPAPHAPVTIRYRKPHGAWRQRTVPARRLEETILQLEDQGAEIAR